MAGTAVDAPVQLSADEMPGAFRRGELSPVEVLDSLIERVAKTSEVNAVAEEMFDEAHDVARAAEARYAGKARRPGRSKASRSR
ncbi:hypothetical protein [Streptomyces sp. NBRC 110028]|uniref:hypothetical protein n=1 Tax=Streptomyces sp. NBRC 110028 TaxID=1621260 RepID=UPI0006E2B404|nr:hypothetical protein [Streptomyces sp. NBRC 110028]